MSGPTTQAQVRNPPAGAWPIALAGLVSLAVAMGVGRFAFTPLLPLMLAEGHVGLGGASWLASANYFGYLLGALACMLQPWLWARFHNAPLLAYANLVRGGLVATGLLTLAMAWPLPALWPLLRFAAGLASAVVFVYISGWCLARLAALGVPGMAGLIYVGPGAGIVVSGLFASGMLAWHWTAAAGWLVFGLLAFALTALVWRSLQGGSERLARRVASAPAADAAAKPSAAQLGLFTLGYGIAGFGYIITATFLPVIARTALPGSPWLDLFWPVFGVGVMLGAVIATRVPQRLDRRVLLVGCYAMQAAGIAATVASPSLTGFALGSLLLGLPFTVITFFAMQEARRLRPGNASGFMGLITAAYGLGQIVGPPLAAALVARSASAGAGFTLALEIAAGALLLGALLFAGLARAFPLGAAVK